MDQDSTSPATSVEPTKDTPLSSKLGIWGQIDNTIFAIETVIVVTALTAMSIMVSTSVLYNRVFALSHMWSKGETKGWVMAAIGLFFFGLLAYSASRARRKDKDRSSKNMWIKEVLIGCTGALIILLIGVLMMSISSATTYIILTIALLIPITRLFWHREEKLQAMLTLMFGIIAMFMMRGLPDGYSWSQSYALFLLLWVGFLGASMAARVRRHLRVDLMRKLVPKSKLALFNTVSYLVAASFSAIIAYLGMLYIFGEDSTYLKPIWEIPTWLPTSLRADLEVFPLPADAGVMRRIFHVVFSPTNPGELPDWLKVAAIPVSFTLITLRFLGHSIAFAKMTLQHEVYSDSMEVH